MSNFQLQNKIIDIFELCYEIENDEITKIIRSDHYVLQDVSEEVIVKLPRMPLNLKMIKIENEYKVMAKSLRLISKHFNIKHIRILLDKCYERIRHEKCHLKITSYIYIINDIIYSLLDTSDKRPLLNDIILEATDLYLQMKLWKTTCHSLAMSLIESICIFSKSFDKTQNHHLFDKFLISVLMPMLECLVDNSCYIRKQSKSLIKTVIYKLLVKRDLMMKFSFV